MHSKWFRLGTLSAFVATLLTLTIHNHTTWDRYQIGKKTDTAVRNSLAPLNPLSAQNFQNRTDSYRSIKPICSVCPLNLLSGAREASFLRKKCTAQILLFVERSWSVTLDDNTCLSILKVLLCISNLCTIDLQSCIYFWSVTLDDNSELFRQKSFPVYCKSMYFWSPKLYVLHV